MAEVAEWPGWQGVAEWGRVAGVAGCSRPQPGSQDAGGRGMPGVAECQGVAGCQGVAERRVAGWAPGRPDEGGIGAVWGAQRCGVAELSVVAEGSPDAGVPRFM
ncbi:hypothetical protein GCM10009789_17090 [Kribbella sancticallisti]|uniref:Uncharacterized protein n=1 Tax=Kribbella sancticallisti TaxID=460087 RepID=A0ABN2CTV7_9ACTN